MSTSPNILVTQVDWVDLNTLSGIAVGTKVFISNEHFGWALLQESPTKPLNSSTAGIKLTPKTYNYADATIAAGSERIWAKSWSGNNTELSVQAIA